MIVPVDDVAFRARLEPSRPAIADLASGRTWTYAALDDAIARCATWLHTTHACRIGDRVASLARNRAELVLLHLACARIGAIYVPLNWRLAATEIAALLADADPRVLVGDGELGRADLSGVAIETLAAAIASVQPAPAEPVDPARPSLILYTSGTSGRPKGALLSEHSLAQTAINFGRLGHVTRDSVFLVDAPMFHIIGLVTNVRPALMYGGTVLVSNGFDAVRTLQRMADPALRVSHYFAVPQMVAQLRAVPGFDPVRLRGLQAIFTGGGPHPAADIRAWLRDGIAVADGFGMSEAGTVFGMPLERERIDAKAGSVGVAPPSIGARIVDSDGGACPLGVAGELLLKGDHLFSGYWRRPKETATAFTPDGWFRTGDIATCDADGYFTIVDRAKDMFISGGENVYPAEIEAVLAGHPDLVEVAVVGVPDPHWGEIGHAVIVRAAGASVDLEALRAYLGERMARYKLPKHLTVVDALPRTGSGKVQKTVLRARLLALRETDRSEAVAAAQLARTHVPGDARIGVSAAAEVPIRRLE